MGAYVADLEQHVIADCWHWMPEAKPDGLNQLVIAWLTRRFPSR